MDGIAMGGYGVYVWSSFGLMFIVVLVTAVQARNRHHKMTQEIRMRIQALEAQK